MSSEENQDYGNEWFRFLAKGLMPIRKIKVSQWSEAYRVLGPAVSNRPGPWRNNVTPYLVPIMDCLSVFSPYKHVVIMKGTQVGATSIIENFVGYCMHITPGPIMLMYPTLGVSKKNSKKRYAPMIKDSPVLRGIVSPAKSRDGNNTILEKDFAGGNLSFVGAESPNDVRSVNIRFLGLDEIDEYTTNLAEQGNPIAIALKRTSTYDHNKKVVYVSTPKIKGTSNIDALFIETDQNHIYLPCPHCAPNMPVTADYELDELMMAEIIPGFQKLVLEQFRFTQGNPAAVYYECLFCKKEIHNHHKSYMLPRFRLMPDAPEKANKLRIGFHINAFYSAIGFYSWSTMAEDYEKALKDPNEMITFVQTTLGLPYEEDGTQPAYKLIFQRTAGSPYKEDEIPDEVCFLTAGIDVQKDRIEAEIVGWGKGKRSFSIGYRIFIGNPALPEVWNEVSKMLYETWIRESDGMIFGLSMTLIDEGYLTNQVYAFALSHGLSKILPCDGAESMNVPISSPQPVFLKKDGKKSAALVHIRINTDFYKTAIYSYLGLQRTDSTGYLGPENYCHFPNSYQEEHYKRLTAEKKVSTPNSRGYESSSWKKIYHRNEQLDCRVYAMAAATLFGIDRFTDVDYDKLVGALMPKKSEKKTNIKKPTGGLPGIGGLPDL